MGSHRRGASNRTSPRLLVTLVAALAALVALQIAAGADNEDDGLGGAVYSVDATPDGGFIVAENTSVLEVRNGDVRHVATLPTQEMEEDVAPVNGIAALSRGNLFATTGGLDASEDAALWRVSQGNQRLVADLAGFEHANDPDATEGFAWKAPECEAADGFTAGPQTNPYQLTAISGSEVLVADAAGNSLLWAKTNGQVDWVAVFPPATERGADPGDEDNWIHYEPALPDLLPDDVDCYLQPVPTAVDIGPDGAIYVGELLGGRPDMDDPGQIVDLARVWRIEAGARNVTCPSEDCTVVVEGLTSVVDLEFGPDGLLYVLEMDANGWIAPLIPEAEPLQAGGTVKACDVDDGGCSVVESGIATPSSITFDRRGDLWVVESMFFEPELRQVDLG